MGHNERRHGHPGIAQDADRLPIVGSRTFSAPSQSRVCLLALQRPDGIALLDLHDMDPAIGWVHSHVFHDDDGNRYVLGPVEVKRHALQRAVHAVLLTTCVLSHTRTPGNRKRLGKWFQLIIYCKSYTNASFSNLMSLFMPVLSKQAFFPLLSSTWFLNYEDALMRA